MNRVETFNLKASTLGTGLKQFLLLSQCFKSRLLQRKPLYVGKDFLHTDNLQCLRLQQTNLENLVGNGGPIYSKQTKLNNFSNYVSLYCTNILHEYILTRHSIADITLNHKWQVHDIKLAITFSWWLTSTWCKMT